MNGYIAHQWKSFINRDNLGEAGDFLNLKAPKNVLFALNTACANATSTYTVGFLEAIGYKNLVNVKKIVESDQVQGGISQGRE